MIIATREVNRILRHGCGVALDVDARNLEDRWLDEDVQRASALQQVMAQLLASMGDSALCTKMPSSLTVCRRRRCEADGSSESLAPSRLMLLVREFHYTCL